MPLFISYFNFNNHSRNSSNSIIDLLLYYVQSQVATNCKCVLFMRLVLLLTAAHRPCMVEREWSEDRAHREQFNDVVSAYRVFKTFVRGEKIRIE